YIIKIILYFAVDSFTEEKRTQLQERSIVEYLEIIWGVLGACGIITSITHILSTVIEGINGFNLQQTRPRTMKLIPART
ncbi:hypothetical protein MKX03_023860, partial [Papaver bracteatum]